MPKEVEAGESPGAKAFAVFADQMATEVADENAKLEEEIAFLKPLRDILDSVEFCAGDRVFALPGLGSAEIDGRGAIVIRITSEDGPTLPLEKYRFGANLYVSQKIVGEFPGSANPYVSRCYGDGSLRLTIYDSSGNVGIRGTLKNLGCEDLEKIMNERGETVQFQCKTIGRYLKEGRGMNSPGATFAPDLMIIFPNSGAKSPGIYKSALLAQRPFVYEVGASLQIMQESIEKMTLALKKLQGKHDKLAHAIVQPQQSFRRKNLERALKGVRAKLDLIARQRTESAALERQFRAQKQQLLARFATSLEEHSDSVGTSPAGELRELVFSVDERPKNKAMLRQNCKLRFERQNLKDIQSRIGAVELFFHGGDLNLSLRRGFKANLGDLVDVWCIQFPSGQTPSIEAERLHSLEVYVSGVCSKRVTGRMSGTNPDDPLSIPFEIGYDSGLCLRACLQFGSRDSLVEIQRTGLLARAMSAATTGERGSPSLPADCVVRLRSIHFRLNSIANTLEMVRLRPGSDSTQPG